MIGYCTNKSRLTAVANGTSTTTVVASGTEVANHAANLNMTYDVIYKLGSLEITNKPYGGSFYIYFYLKDTIKFLPCIHYYRYTTTSALTVDTKPCYYKCAECDKT